MKHLTTILVVVALVVFIGGLTAFIWWSVRPKGEVVGSFDTAGKAPGASFDAKVGDEILFRLDYEFDLNPVKSFLEDDERVADEARRKSRFDVELTDAAGSKQHTTCPAYAGKSISSGQIGPRHSETGVIVDCKFIVPRDGRYTATGTVSFETARHVESKVEVRRLRAGS